MDQATTIVLKPEKRGTFLAHHPWVLDKSLVSPDVDIPDGQEVDVTLPGGRWIARGIYNRRSRIRVRLYTWDRRQPLDDAFWHSQLARALELRQVLGLVHGDHAARLVHSEADGLSGLVVDRYGSHLVIQLTSLAMALRLPTIITWLVENLAPRAILVRTEPHTAAAEGIDVPDGCVWGTPPHGPVEIDEHSLRLRVDLVTGQKTGCYLDQRDNHREVARWMAGRRVLDLFCYTGGFGLAAAKLGQADEVLGIDSSRSAIARAIEHAALNGLANVHYEVAEVFELLPTWIAQGRTFDAVVVDPPRFASRRASVPKALAAYHRLNTLAVQLLTPHGILATCSCSGLVSAEEFRQMLVGVSRKTNREIQVLQQRGAPPDHPVSLSCPETGYLKCFVCRVI